MLTATRPLSEDLLQLIWSLQDYDRSGLYTPEGEEVQVLFPGHHNRGAGPDFSHASLRIGQVHWHGDVEVHLLASDWYAHGHQQDRAYDKVVLHVVWEADVPVARTDGTQVPALVLGGRISEGILSRYQSLGHPEPLGLPCARLLGSVPRLQRFSMLDRCLHERLLGRAALLLQEVEQLGGDWEEVAYRRVAEAFGFGTNREAFGQLARCLPLRLLLLHADRPLQVEALLFGQAGLLPTSPPDTYTGWLCREYALLAHKYGLQPMDGSVWKHGRLRPTNAPCLRIAQLGALLGQQGKLFARLLFTQSLPELLLLLQVEASAYWQAHIHFGKGKKEASSRLSADAARLLLVNAAVPLLAAYAQHREDAALQERAYGWLEQLPAERNHVTDLCRKAGLPIRSAADGQGALELYGRYCQMGRCLDCSIGVKAVRGE